MAQTKQLTTELIMFKTKTNQLDRIRNLNLCANDLAHIEIVSQMTALEVLSLSVNSISTLKDIGSCPNLKELYIRRNCVESLDEIQYLVPLRSLRIMWLAENPVATVPGYRNAVIKALPQLEKLDNVEITSEERSAAQSSSTSTSQVEQPRSMAEGQFQENNSFAAAAKHRNHPQESQAAAVQVNDRQPQNRIRDNPNSTNPYFANKMRSPENETKPRNIGFDVRKEIGRSPEPLTKEATPEKWEEPALAKQHTRQAQVQRKIVEKPTRHDMGNNYIRKGTGLARTPPRADERNSYSNSPIEQHEAPVKIDVSNRAFPDQLNDPEESNSPITWPSRVVNPKKQSPMDGRALQVNQPQTTSNRQNLNRLPSGNSAQQQVQMQGKQSSPTLMVPRQIRSPQKPVQAQAPPQLAMPQIAMPPNLTDPVQMQQLLQLNQLLLQQQQLGAMPAAAQGFSGLVQQQNQQKVAEQQKPAPQKKQRAAGGATEHPYRRDENILCAILALLKELDKNGLEFVIKDCNKRIAKMENFQ